MIGPIWMPTYRLAGWLAGWLAFLLRFGFHLLVSYVCASDFLLHLPLMKPERTINKPQAEEHNSTDLSLYQLRNRSISFIGHRLARRLLRFRLRSPRPIQRGSKY